ncbi:MAG TPA: peptidyl-alpha-hydroxyglycine alpha-amidating lyase family protein [Bryobacteraceae bacterium]|nr:peptidyl-alpha-hydroxyglycine alpha-amidating lyase family protein [Bryobacteraceae bacterium]
MRFFFFAGAFLIAASAGVGADSHYRLLENWGQSKWGSVTGVDVDAQDNVYVFQRGGAAPIEVFDRNGKLLRSWGEGMFKTPHFLRVDLAGNVWVTDRGHQQVFEFDSAGKLLMTLGTKDVTGDNNSQDAFNGTGDVAIAKSGEIFVADGEGRNTRVVKFSPEGKFIAWWGGKGTGPGQFNVPHSIAIGDDGRIYVADRSNNRIQIFDTSGKFLDQWTNFGTPWGLFVKDGLLYCVDGSDNNVLLIANTKDGKIVDRIEGLHNPTAVAVDSTGAIYVGEVNGMSVKKFVKGAL